MRTLSLIWLATLLVGCGVTVTKTADPVEVSGKVTVKGKPISDVVLAFQPTGSGAPSSFPVKNGDFKGNVIPGKYTYYLVEGKPGSLNTVPTPYRSGSLDRQISVSGGNVEIKID